MKTYSSDEVRARLVWALGATGANAATLSTLAGRNASYIGDFLRGRTDRLDDDVARFLEGTFGMERGSLGCLPLGRG